MRPATAPTGIERFFGDDEIIVSKTDLKGKITYANEVFIRVAGYTEEELLGAPHNIIRHPDMPHAVFKLLWDQIEAGREIFAYVVNQCKNGDHYWVYAHVTPTFGTDGKITGYHSNRRVPTRAAVEKAAGLYGQLRELEAKSRSQKEGMQAAAEALGQLLSEHQVDYDEFVFSL